MKLRAVIAEFREDVGTLPTCVAKCGHCGFLAIGTDVEPGFLCDSCKQEMA